ncbi:MAG: hypothetical protein WCK27_13815 [Verrucomicrobiota bacterium]
MSDPEMSEPAPNGGSFLRGAAVTIKVWLGVAGGAVAVVIGVIQVQKEMKGEKQETKAATPVIVITTASMPASNGVVVVVPPTLQSESISNPGPSPAATAAQLAPASSSTFVTPVTSAGPHKPRVVRNEISIPRFESTEEVEYLVSDAKGEGTTRQIALSMALTEAISKRVGSQISDQAVLALKSVAVDENGHTSERVDQEIRSRYESATDGLIKWWDIKVEEEDGNTFKVEVVAVLARITTPASRHSTRKTLAVLPFKIDGDAAVKGRTVPAAVIGKQVRESALTYLVNSRKFAVLDQTFDKELDKLAGEQPATDPIQRAIAVARKLGAQYAVIGIVSGFEISQRHVASLDVPIVDGLANLRIIQVDNRQTVLASAFRLGDLPNLELDGSHPENSIADSLGRAMSDRALETIYPFKVTALNSPDEVILNRGGDDLSVGQRFDLCNPGEKLKDPSTGESLGVAERKVATVEITRVLPKVSYAKVISKTEDIMVEAICRKPQQPNAEAKNKPANIRNEIDNLFK